MKKKLLALLLTCGVVLSVCACGKSKTKEETDSNSALKEEIVKFVNEDLPSIADDKEAAVSIYNDYFSADSEEDSEAWLKKLEEEAIVDYEVYLHNLEQIEVTTPEVTNLKTLYTQSCQAQYDAMGDVINAIKNSDSTLLDSAQDKITQSKDYLNQYKSALQELCTANGILVNGSLESTPSDAAPVETATEAATTPATESVTVAE